MTDQPKNTPAHPSDASVPIKIRAGITGVVAPTILKTADPQSGIMLNYASPAKKTHGPNYARTTLILGACASACFSLLLLYKVTPFFILLAAILGVASEITGLCGCLRQRPLNSASIVMLVVGMLLGTAGIILICFVIFMMLFFVP